MTPVSSPSSNSRLSASVVQTVYSREQQEQLLILQAEVELLLTQLKSQTPQPALLR